MAGIERRYHRPQIPIEIDIAYRAALAKEPRWIGGEEESSKPESDLDHVDALFNLLDEIKITYPALAKGLDLTAVEDMIYVHDGGEIISHDLTRSDPDYEAKKKKHKRKEDAGARWLTKTHIKDDTLRQEARSVYRRYRHYSSNDPEALFVHLLDKIQAIRFGLEHVYNANSLKIKSDPEQMKLARKQAAMSVDLIFEFAGPLLAITSGEMRSELFIFIRVELGRYWTGGFPEITRDARSRLFSIKDARFLSKEK
jgi:hypothetical protein